MKIGELARKAGCTAETVRYYERTGVLPRAPRKASGYRRYGADAVERLRFIRAAQTLGFTLAEIRELLSLRVQAGASCADVRARTQDKIATLWPQLRSRLKSRWSRLTESDLNVAHGDAQYLAHRLQERYGTSLQETVRQLAAFSQEL